MWKLQELLLYTGGEIKQEHIDFPFPNLAKPYKKMIRVLFLERNDKQVLRGYFVGPTT